MSSGKVIKKAANTVGKQFALAEMNDGTYSVYARAENYAAHCRGGIAYTWRVAAKGLGQDEAARVFEKKIEGRQK